MLLHARRDACDLKKSQVPKDLRMRTTMLETTSSVFLIDVILSRTFCSYDLSMATGLAEIIGVIQRKSKLHLRFPV